MRKFMGACEHAEKRVKTELVMLMIMMMMMVVRIVKKEQIIM